MPWVFSMIPTLIDLLVKELPICIVEVMNIWLMNYCSLAFGVTFMKMG